MTTKMTEYPAKRSVSWVDDAGEECGRCEYIRADIADDLSMALDNALYGKMQRAPDVWAHAEEALARYNAAKETT